MAESARKITSGGLHIDQRLYALIAEQIAPGTDVDVDHFWAALEKIVQDLEPKNQQLLQRRDALQAQIDAYHQQRRGEPLDPTDYRAFLEEIGYLLPTGRRTADSHGKHRPRNRLPSRPSASSSQLTMRAMRSTQQMRAGAACTDALYGTDVIEGRVPTGEYDAERGAQVIARSEAFLDAITGLQQGAYREVVEFFLREDAGGQTLCARLASGDEDRPQRRRTVRRLWMRGRAAKQRLAPPQRVAHRNPNRPHSSHWGALTAPASKTCS